MALSTQNLTFSPEPSRPDWFDGELKSFDANLFVAWHAVEGGGSHPHFIVWRNIPEREKAWVVRSGLMVREDVDKKPEKVMDWVDEEGRYLPFDRRIFERLAAMDPGRYRPSMTRIDSYKAMAADRHKATKKEHDERVDKMVEASVDSVLSEASEQRDTRTTMGHFVGVSLLKPKRMKDEG